jgi:phage shock protein C
MTDWEKNKGPIYRSRNGVILGVCRGVADHFGFPAFWLRLGVLFLFFTTGIWPTLIIYFAVALYLKPAPLIPLENESEREFYFSYTSSRLSAMARLKKQQDPAHGGRGHQPGLFLEAADGVMCCMKP